MSYDVSIFVGPCAHCGHEGGKVLDLNYTSNVSRMWYHAGRSFDFDLREYNEKHARELIDPLSRVIATMEADPATYEAMNPENGWGSYDGCLRFLRGILEACRRYPDEKLFVHA